MKRYLLLLALSLGMVMSQAFAGDKTANVDELLRKSKVVEQGVSQQNSSFPCPFNELSQPKTDAAITTGYYFVDSDDEAPDYWRPSPVIVDTSDEPQRWRRVLAGPRIREQQFWIDNPEEGLRFFRNPALPLPSGDFWNGPTDSTDNAIAGPIPIGFQFYFNGLRFDSFYVSTNGLIALTNRRYFYDDSGHRVIPTGATSAYDPMSIDWFDRARSSTTGLDDALADNYGYQYVVCGNNIMSQTAGIRATSGQLNNLSYKAHVIAPFFGNLQLSQFNKNTNLPDDLGRVYYKKYSSLDRLLIYFQNASPVGTLGTPLGSFTGAYDLRRGDQNYLAASAQVLLDKRDSSITVTYEAFDGVAIVSGRGVPCATVFRYNTVAGVRGFARHVNWNVAGGPTYPWGGEYEQYTHYFARQQDPTAQHPRPYVAVKFKQWKNSVRVVDIQYRVRKLDPNSDLNFTEKVPTSKVNNYELLAGEERIGAIQPVAIIQNLTNEIQGPQGVNYHKQALQFRARFRIRNEATGRIVYNRLVPIDSLCLALPDSLTQDCNGDPYIKIRYSSVTKNGNDYTATPLTFPGSNNLNGVPPYGFVQVYFPPFEPNEFVVNHIGRLTAFIIADPTDPKTNEAMRDEWPFDDTTQVKLFVMKRLSNFSDDVTEFHYVGTVPMPSVLKWVNIGAEVVQGKDQNSYYPMPPRGKYKAANNNNSIEDPVIRMDRLSTEREDILPVYAGGPQGGDEIRSFPINLIGHPGAVLSLSVQRQILVDDYPRGWSDNTLNALEPRTVVNSNPFDIFQGSTAPKARFDFLAVEFAQPSPDGIQFITNIEEKRWRNHWRRGGAKAVTDMSAYQLFGGGGYMVGFLETDRDSALSQPANPNLNGLRPDLYDDGIDWEYKKLFVPIPDTIVRSPSEGAKNFRFRIKAYFTNNKTGIPNIPDDNDPVFVDNVKILFPTEITDVELSNVRALWPYTVVPASQAIKIPIRAKVANNTSINAPTFLVKVMIFKGNFYPIPNGIRPVYCRIEQLPALHGGEVLDVVMPNWDARSAGEGTYTIFGHLMIPGGDIEPLNDTTYSTFTLKFGDVFSYELNPNSPRNDVPDQAFSATWGRGLNMFGFAEGGQGSFTYHSGTYDERVYGAGYIGGSGSGQVAVKFQLFQPDTVYGFKVYWAPLNQAYDDILLSIYTNVGDMPGQLLQSVSKVRGYDDIRKDIFWDEYITYLLPKPVVLPQGTYWISVAQLAETGMELGASKQRVGMRQTSIYVPPPSGGPVGGSGIHLVIDKNFRKMNQSGNLINSNFFCFENGKGSGQWQQFMPTVGNPAFGHLHHFGLTAADNATYTLSRGTWIPMIRPYLGVRASATNPKYQDCPDIPVELSSFDGSVREEGIDLYWETQTEKNNMGFYVERRISGNEANEWNSIGFVKGAGTSSTVNRYSYLDTKVTANTTYDYRLLQVDKDGVASCNSVSKVLTLTYSSETSNDVVLEQNTPNPASTSTTIKFSAPANINVKLEILDIYGNLVKSLPVNTNTVDWDCTNEAGIPVVNGTYIYRLTAGDRVVTNKMTVLR